MQNHAFEHDFRSFRKCISVSGRNCAHIRGKRTCKTWQILPFWYDRFCRDFYVLGICPEKAGLYEKTSESGLGSVIGNKNLVESPLARASKSLRPKVRHIRSHASSANLSLLVAPLHSAICSKCQQQNARKYSRRGVGRWRSDKKEGSASSFHFPSKGVQEF